MRADEHQHEQDPLRVNADGIPDELKRRPQWVVWRAVPRDGRRAKVPYNPDGMRPAKTNDASTWRSFACALRCSERGDANGVGFVFAHDDPYAGIDLDGCRDPATGTHAAWSADILAMLDSYAEVSPSGTGVKVIMRGALPCPGTGRRTTPRDASPITARAPEIELYHWGRFFALTGRRLPETPPTVTARHEQLAALYARLFDPMIPQPTPTVATSQRIRLHDQLSDAEMLALARSAQSGNRFSALFDAGCLDAYGGDHSRADLALCAMLAFWTGGNPERMDRLFRRSALLRPKWDERHAADGATYGALTIRKALCG